MPPGGRGPTQHPYDPTAPPSRRIHRNHRCRLFIGELVEKVLNRPRTRRGSIVAPLRAMSLGHPRRGYFDAVTSTLLGDGSPTCVAGAALRCGHRAAA